MNLLRQKRQFLSTYMCTSWYICCNMTCAIMLTYACVHYRVTKKSPYMDMTLVYVCASDPRSGCIVVYIHYHMPMQPYLDRVYVSPTAQRLDICALFPYMCAGPVIINRHFDNKKSRDQHWPITARFMCTKYTFLRPVRPPPLYYWQRDLCRCMGKKWGS